MPERLDGLKVEVDRLPPDRVQIEFESYWFIVQTTLHLPVFGIVLTYALMVFGTTLKLVIVVEPMVLVFKLLHKLFDGTVAEHTGIPFESQLVTLPEPSIPQEFEVCE